MKIKLASKMKDYHCKENIETKYDRCPNCNSTNTTIIKYSDDTSEYEVFCEQCKRIYGGVMTSHGTVIQSYERKS